jgi:hypothetical protein
VNVRDLKVGLFCALILISLTGCSSLSGSAFKEPYYYQQTKALKMKSEEFYSVEQVKTDSQNSMSNALPSSRRLTQKRYYFETP